MTEERPEEYEELYLSNIESQNVMAISEVEAFITKMRNNDTTSEDISLMIRRLGEYERYFLFYNPLVEHFVKLGKPKLSQRLKDVLSDIRDTTQVFQREINKRTPHVNKDSKVGDMSEEEKMVLREHILVQKT